ncbi:MAG: ABC transporter permease, partial [Acidobacteria bacterium]|nr:ABC transporter permease [Acidobacteriota bacterium]
DLGFTPQNALAMDIDPKLKGWPEPRVLQYYRDVQQRLEAIPGVRQIAFANLAPMDLATPRIGVAIEGQQPPPGREPLRLSFNRVSPGYFSVVQVPLIKGRDFSELDDSQKPAVAIINETMAQRFWPGRDPLGQRFRLVRGNDFGFEAAIGGATVEVIGVARNARYRSLGEEPEAHFYLPYLQNFDPARTLLVRTAGDPGPMIGRVQLELQAIDSDLPGFFSRTLEQHAGLALVPARMGAALAGIFGALALLLATVGLYSVVAYTAARRTREIGIRVALGANRRQILSLILGHGMRMVWMGCGLGIAAALALTRFLSALLYGVSPSDVPTYAAVAAVLIAVALLACWIPARRATRVDPMVALRYE